MVFEKTKDKSRFRNQSKVIQGYAIVLVKLFKCGAFILMLCNFVTLYITIIKKRNILYAYVKLEKSNLYLQNNNKSQ